MNQGKTFRLKDRHRWKSKPGYCICVLDRGAVRFDFPVGWIVKHTPDSVRIHDREPPDDNCVLAVSHLRLPPIDWSGLPLRELVAAAVSNEDREILERKDIIERRRGDLELAWVETRYIEARERREALSRVCIGRGSGVQCLITFDLWADDAAGLEPVWNEVLGSLVLGWYVEDPTIGPTTQ